MTIEEDIKIIKDGIALLLEVQMNEIGSNVHCSVINQHFATMEMATKAEKKATENHRNLITRLRR